MAIPGNLFSELTEIFEPDISGWEGSGATLTGVPGSVLGGGTKTVLQRTSSGDGPAEIVSVEAPAVGAGTRYLAYGWAIVQGEGVALRTEIRWYDDADTLLSTDSVTWSLPDLVATRLNVGGEAPEGAVSARLAIVEDTPPEGREVFFDEMFLGREPNPEDNLLTYDEYSVEYSLAEWAVENGSVTQVLNRQPIGEGAYLMEVAPSSRGLVTTYLDRQIPVTAGQTYSLATYVYTRAAGDPNATVTARPSVRWYSADGELLDVGTPEPYATVSGTQTYVGLRTSRTRTAPEGADSAQVRVEIDHNANTTATEYLVDQVTFEPSEPEYTITVSNARGYIALDLQVVPPGEPTHYSVYRVDEDGSYSPVRGYGSDMVNVPYPGERVLIEDYEAPIGTRVYYRIVWAGGESEVIELMTHTVNAPIIEDTSFVWVKHPGLPALNRRVMMAATPSWERAGRSAMYQIVGRSRPVVVSEVRASRTGVLQIHIWRADDHEAFNALMDSGQTILFQAAPGHGLDGNLYLSIDDVAWEPESWDATVPEYLWSLGVTEVDRPAGGIQGSAGRTWQDVLDNYQTWHEVLDAYGSWADVLTGGATDA